MTTWVLTANSSSAKLYASDNLRIDELHLVQEFVHPDSRKKVTELVSDRPGRYATDGGAHSAFVKGSPKDVEAEHFAFELLNTLEAGAKQKSFSSLIIVAPAHFSAWIKKHFHQANLSVEPQYINKDYTKYTDKKLAETMREHLFSLG